MRRAARRDSNEPDIIRHLRGIPGFEVSDALPPGDFGDRLVRKASWPAGVWVQVEIKSEKNATWQPHQTGLVMFDMTFVATTAQEIIEYLDSLRLEYRSNVRRRWGGG